MRRHILPIVLVTTALVPIGLVPTANGDEDRASHSIKSKTIKGWISDEQCARGRASSGVFTGTSPRCAKECVAKGRKIVFVDPEAKRVVTIENQSAAREHIGDYVEITGAISPRTKLLHVDSLKMISVGIAACERAKLGR